MTAAEREKSTAPELRAPQWGLKCPLPEGRLEQGRYVVDHDKVAWVWVHGGSRPLDQQGVGPSTVRRFGSEAEAQRYNLDVWTGGCRVERIPESWPPMSSEPWPPSEAVLCGVGKEGAAK